jgi:Glycosyltransferase like family 2
LPRRVNRLIDVAYDAGLAATLTGARLDRLAARYPPRRVLLLAIYGSARHLRQVGADPQATRHTVDARYLRQVVADARASRHSVEFGFGCLQAADPELASHTLVSNLSGYKFPNINAVLRAIGPGRTVASDWVIIVDDDIEIMEGFFDRFLGLLEHFDVAIAQPALTRMSYLTWLVTRRRPFSLLRETWYVEPQLVAFRSDVVRELLPFSEAYDGFGQDYRWAWLARRNGWRVAVIDAVPVRHESRQYGTQYSWEHAGKQRERALSDHPSLPHGELNVTRSTHRSLRRSR